MMIKLIFFERKSFVGNYFLLKKKRSEKIFFYFFFFKKKKQKKKTSIVRKKFVMDFVADVPSDKLILINQCLLH